jgi:hypothetical protein
MYPGDRSSSEPEEGSHPTAQKISIVFKQNEDSTHDVAAGHRHGEILIPSHVRCHLGPAERLVAGDLGVVVPVVLRAAVVDHVVCLIVKEGRILSGCEYTH